MPGSPKGRIFRSCVRQKLPKYDPYVHLLCSHTCATYIATGLHHINLQFHSCTFVLLNSVPTMQHLEMKRISPYAAYLTSKPACTLFSWALNNLQYYYHILHVVHSPHLIS